MPGIHWGARKENGIWLAGHRRRRLCWRGHDSLYIAVGRLRLRLMKPARWQQVTVPTGFAARIRAGLHAAADQAEPGPHGLDIIRARTRR